MKTVLQFLIIGCFVTMSAQNIVFADANLKAFLLNENCIDTNADNIPDSDADVNNDGEIQLSEATSLTNLYLGKFPDTYHVASVEDLREFTNLEKLRIIYFNTLESFELLGLTNLTDFYIGTCASMKRIDLSDLPNLMHQSIEDIAGLEYLNMKNNSFPSGTFSLFYTENIVFACIDDSPQEYAAVQYHMQAGVLPSILCELGISEVNLETDIQLVPNPAKDIVTLTTNNNYTIKALTLLDISGRIVTTQATTFENLNISKLATGVYFLKLELSNGRLFTKKLLKE
jgi:hypothetical protein